MIHRPEICSIIPQTLLPVSTCCLGYRIGTRPRETRFHISTAPVNLQKQQFSGENFHTEYSHCVLGVKTSYLQRSHCEAAHVVPEDQSAMWPCGGDDRGLEVRGVTIAPI